MCLSPAIWKGNVGITVTSQALPSSTPITSKNKGSQSPQVNTNGNIRWNKSHLPTFESQYPQYRNKFCPRFFGWIGAQPVTFNTNGINMVEGMQKNWNEILPDVPHQIEPRQAVYDIVCLFYYRRCMLLSRGGTQDQAEALQLAQFNGTGSSWQCM